MSGRRNERNSRTSSIARGLSKDRKWGLQPSKARQSPEELFPNKDLRGAVLRFNTERGFGFAEFDGLPVKDGRVFVHNESVKSPPGGKMRKGSRIMAGVIQTDRGPRAVNIRIM